MSEDGTSDGSARSHVSTRVVGWGEHGLELAENLVYTLVAILLILAALVLLGSATRDLVAFDDDVDVAVLALLDQLLLVFVLVELLFAVRMTLTRREIVAEPFLIVGIIASIKEIVLLSVEAANVIEGKSTSGEDPADPATFALLIGLLGLMVLLLSASALLLRLKERAPVEGKRSASERQRDVDGDGLADQEHPVDGNDRSDSG